MKRFLHLLLVALLFLNVSSQIIRDAKSTCVSTYFAIIVLGSDEFANASERCYDLMSYLRCYEILYLSTNLSKTPNANLTANRANLQWALTTWLREKSTLDTQIWLWIFSHGIGLRHWPKHGCLGEEKWVLPSDYKWLAEINSDEGLEITEWLINREGVWGGLDVNGDGVISNDTWVGIDEALYLYSDGKEIVRDDELKQWFEGIRYRRMVIVINTCQAANSENETESCYGGGFIDDLSGPRRIIITSTNETYTGYYNKTTGIGFFEEPFMNALDPRTTAWSEAAHLVDYDYITSVLEAYIYARQHDMARIAVRNPSGYPEDDPWRDIYVNYEWIDESPWMDDGGNFKPTFMDGSDVDQYSTYWGYDSDDGQLARYTWPIPSAYSSCVEDINDDWRVDLDDIYIASGNFGHTYPDDWNSKCSLADLNQDNRVDMADVYLICKKFGWQG